MAVVAVTFTVTVTVITTQKCGFDKDVNRAFFVGVVDKTFEERVTRVTFILERVRGKKKKGEKGKGKKGEE